jgi:hypothetical protein
LQLFPTVFFSCPQITDSGNVLFKYPEYVQFDQDTSTLDSIVSVLVWFPHRDEKLGVRSVSVVGQLEEPVQVLLDSVFKKHKLTTGTSISTVESGVFVFKVVGYAEYLLHMGYQLADYDYVREAMRKQLKIELELVELSVIDAADLAGSLGMSRSAAIEAELQKRRPNGDDWLASETTLRKAGSAEDAIDFADIHWPLRVSDEATIMHSTPRSQECVLLTLFLLENRRWCGVSSDARILLPSRRFGWK